MKSIIEIIKKVARKELLGIHTTELGIVTDVFPHEGDGDKDNYQCSIKVKNKKLFDGKDFELRKVPVATPHMGLVCIPNIDDLVLINFIGGDINSPVITGRLYNDEARPPANKKKEVLLQHNAEEGGSIKLDEDGKIILTSKAENDNCSITIEDGAISIDAGAKDIFLKSSGGGIKIGDASTSSVVVGGKSGGVPVCDNDTIKFTAHTHVGNLGAPCPVMIGIEKLDSVEAKARTNTKVG